MSNQSENRAKALLDKMGKLVPKKDEQVDVGKVISDLISTSFGGSNAEQLKAVQLLKGLATSDDPKSNKFMQALDKWTSGLDPKSFE